MSLMWVAIVLSLLEEQIGRCYNYPPTNSLQLIQQGRSSILGQVLDDFDAGRDIEFSVGERSRQLLQVPPETFVVELLTSAEVHVRDVAVEANQSGWLSIDPTKRSNDASTTSDVEQGLHPGGDGVQNQIERRVRPRYLRHPWLSASERVHLADLGKG